ncbi:hypothetical protein [Deinococcus pimensis]|uniref:hypothetical protein n=1 Tax=Deinococcus pimensis TaxID=309888 RepID=UPI0004B21429|nr:hypothetical protein [Deinococcus pimensis]
MITSPRHVILGAGDQAWDGWTPTQREHLDLTDRASFDRFFGDRRVRDGRL